MDQGEICWAEGFFKIIPLPYPVVALLISVIIYLLYKSFSVASDYNMGLIDHVVAITMGLLIGYQIGAIKYLLDILRNTLTNLSELSSGENIDVYRCVFYLFSSYWRYVIIICIVLPFYIVDWLPFSNETIYDYFFPFSTTHNSIWAILFDIFMNIVGLLSEIMLAIIFWIIFNMTYALWYVRDFSSRTNMDISAQRMNLKMYSIRSLLSTAITLCIASISLAIFSYADPDTFYSTEIVMLLFLMLTSLILYFLAIDSTQQILRNQIIYEIDCLLGENQKHVQNLITISLKDSKENNIDKINEISSMLDVLKKQKEELEIIFPKRHSIKSFSTKVIAISGSFLIPIVSGLFKMMIENSQIKSQINYIINEAVFNLLGTGP